MKFDRILFPIDDSDHCRSLAPQVAWLAGLFESRVTLLHVTDIPSTSYAATEAYYDCDSFKMLADRARQRLHEFPIDLPESRLERVAMEGNAARQIVTWANRHSSDLIIMGTHSCGTLRGFLLGSVAEKVIHEVDCPVWIRCATQSATQSPSEAQNPANRNLVCALELTDEAVPLLRFTREFADRTGIRVLLVHSVPELEARAATYPNPLYEHLVQSAQEEIALLQQTAGTAFPVHVTSEGISKSIACAARNQQADLIVIGRGSCQKMLGHLRTHAYEIIRQSSCPVLTFSCAWAEKVSSSSLEHTAAVN